MSAPDRIWSWASNRVRFIGCNREAYTERLWSETMLPDVAETIGAKRFIASTPAREHAEELAEALRHMVYLQNGGPSTGIDAMKKLITASTLLSKLDRQNTGETDAD